jgi:hypothetical protein
MNVKYNSRAFLAICIEPGSESKALAKIRMTEGIDEAHQVYGVYNIFAAIGADSPDQIRDRVIKMKKDFPYISSCTTMLIQGK